MPHIHTQPGQHDHTVSIYIFRTDFDEPKVMLHLHRKIGTYAQFGGHVELSETPWQSVIHELKEESGYDISQLAVLQPSTQPVPIANAVVHPHPVAHVTMGFPGEIEHFHTDSIYAFVTAEEPRDLPVEGESTDIKLFTQTELSAQDNSVVDEVTRDTAFYIFNNCLPNWTPVSPSTFK